MIDEWKVNKLIAQLRLIIIDHNYQPQSATRDRQQIMAKKQFLNFETQSLSALFKKAYSSGATHWLLLAGWYSLNATQWLPLSNAHWKPTLLTKRISWSSLEWLNWVDRLSIERIACWTMMVLDSKGIGQ